MTREQTYERQLRELGVWEDAFVPLVRDLAKAERRRTRAEKAWSATAPPGGKPSFLDPHYQIVAQLDREILGYREVMGLTPKSLRRLRGASEAPVERDLIAQRLDTIAERVGAYDIPDPAEKEAEWAELAAVLNLDTAEETDCHASTAALARNDKSGPSRATAPTAQGDE